MILGHITRDQARRDIIESYLFLHYDNPNAAEGFLAAIQTTIVEPMEMPQIGAKRVSSNPCLQGLRSRQVKGFSNWIVFYLANDNLIDVVRVLHGARDIDQLLADDI